jgi:phosphonate transport system permease protein
MSVRSARVAPLTPTETPAANLPAAGPRFELNLRESLILGVVGAGGIGFYIQTYVRSFQYEKAATVTLAVALVILLIELVNAALRRRVS